MAGSLNKVTLLGSVGKDPIVKSMNNGNEVANFSVATSESWKGKDGEKVEKVQWHNIVCFSKGLVGIIKSYVKKGSKVYIEGALQTRKWTDKDGNDKYTTEVVLQGFNATIILLDKKGDNQSGGNSGYSSNDGRSASAQEADEIDDEIPF